MTVIDHQAHWFPRPYLESLVGRSTHPLVERTAGGEYRLLLDDGADQPAMPALARDIEEHLAEASAAGIDVLVIGPATLGEVLHLPAGEAAELLDRLHEHYAAAQRDHPERVVALAGLPMQDPQAAIAVLDRAIGEHDLRGVALLTSEAGRPIASEAMWPVYARIAELGVPVFLHPGFRSGAGRLRTFRLEVGLGWMLQTAAAALELVDSGLLDAVPGLVVVHPHLGGVLPYVAGRISPLAGSAAEHPLEQYLATRFYVDTAAATPPALALACRMYGDEHVVFASDHPFISMETVRRYVEDNLPPAVAQRIYANRVPGLRLPGAP
jgi:predicted TIM-barrel fold metal-dependent hydrolase